MISLRAFVLTVGLALICALQVTPGVGVGDVQAQAADPCMSSTATVITCQTRENAWNRCMVQVNGVQAAHPTWTPLCYFATNHYSCAINSAFGTPCGGYGGMAGGSSGFYWTVQCAAGETWKDASKICWSSAKCIARNTDLGALANTARPSLTTSRCVVECDFSMANYTTALVPSTGQSVYRGVMKYTGLACTVSATNPAGTLAAQKTAPVQECIPVAGSTVCLKGDGQHCVTTKQGRQMCWKPFEVGEKTDAQVLQVRSPGTLPATPATAPPPGDTFVQSGDPITTTTTDPTQSASTTFTNYTTVSGVNAGTQDQGGNADGSAGDSGSTGGTGDSRSAEDSDNLDKIKQGVYGDGSDPSADTTGLDAVAGTAVAGETEYGAEGFDGTGFGYGSTCPAPISVEVMGQTITLDASGVVCQWVTIGGWFVLMIAGIACMRIVVGGGKG